MCLLCELANKEDNLIYSDDVVGAVVLSNGNALGHVKVFPKEHIEKISEASDELMERIAQVQLKITSILVEQVGYTGYNVMVNAFPLEHFSIDIIPRFDNDGIHFNPKVDESEKKNLVDTQKRLKASLNVIDMTNYTSKIEIDNSSKNDNVKNSKNAPSDNIKGEIDEFSGLERIP